MRLTLVHPAIGRHAGDRSYIRSWQMEPLAPAVLAGLTPPGVEIRFYDDRLEEIPYDEPCDLVALSVETYTARRAYQIASEYRRRGVPVVMGGFHATLATSEVTRWADAVVVGEAEGLWPLVVDDFRHGTLQRVYRHEVAPILSGLRADRRIFRGKRYLKLPLVETARGCKFRCDFCSIQTFHAVGHRRRDLDDFLAEITEARDRGRLFFFVDDNLTSDRAGAAELFRALIPLEIRWVSQASIDCAHDEELLELMVRSGCQGLLVGFESLDRPTLVEMGKGFNTMRGGYEVALANLRRHGIRLYGTFVFGYDRDTPESFDRALELASAHRFYMAAFNHLTPFPGTPRYQRLESAGRLTYAAWWNDPRYRYNQVPFRPARLEPEELQRLCLETRARFYSLPGIARRWADPVNRGNGLMTRSFPLINLMLRREVRQRDGLPLGDEGWSGEWLPVAGGLAAEAAFGGRHAS